MNILNLKPGVVETPDYNAFYFPGGEIHFKLKHELKAELLKIHTRLNTPADREFLFIVIDTIKKDNPYVKLELFIPYFPYQQADRDFGVGECFSLRTFTNHLNAANLDYVSIFDAHSDVTTALVKNSHAVDNSKFIETVLEAIHLEKHGYLEIFDPPIVLSPDAGAYKKIGKLMDKIKFQGEIAAANKYRSLSTGNIESLELSLNDFKGNDVLIIDDICMGGRTFIGLAEKLRERNVGDLYLAVSHGIFNNGFDELRKHFKMIFTTNSRQDKFSDPDFVKVFDII